MSVAQMDPSPIQRLFEHLDSLGDDEYDDALAAMAWDREGFGFLQHPDLIEDAIDVLSERAETANEKSRRLLREKVNRLIAVQASREQSTVVRTFKERTQQSMVEFTAALDAQAQLLIRLIDTTSAEEAMPLVRRYLHTFVRGNGSSSDSRNKRRALVRKRIEQLLGEVEP